MQLHDTMLCQAKRLRKDGTRLRDYKNQMHDAVETLQKLRLHHGGSKKREEELQSELEEAQKEVEKKQRFMLENHNLLERMELKNKCLRDSIISLTKELETSHQTAKICEEQTTNLQGIVRQLSEELSLAKEKSFEA